MVSLSPQRAEDRRARETAARSAAGERLVPIAIALVLAYLALALSGRIVVVAKTAILPIVVLYGVLQRERLAFLQDWLPFVCATLLFDALRGAIHLLVLLDWRPVYSDYVIAWERAFIGAPAATYALQTLRSPLVDRAAAMFYLSHFLAFFGCGLTIWHLRREAFWQFRAAMIGIMVVGLASYLLVPTAPPWLASMEGRIPPIETLRVDAFILPTLFEAFNTNPVAAMPSLHIALPVACALLCWRVVGRTAGVGWSIYTVAMAWAVMYSGNHYAVDVLAGAVVGGLSMALVHRASPGPRWRVSRLLLASAVMLACVFAIASIVTQARP